jgi:hypothetical protein
MPSTLPFEAVQKFPDIIPSQPIRTPQRKKRLVESRWSLGREDLSGRILLDAVGEGELEVLLEKLLDVRAADVGGLGDLNDLEDLSNC